MVDHERGKTGSLRTDNQGAWHDGAIRLYRNSQQQNAHNVNVASGNTKFRKTLNRNS